MNIFYVTYMFMKKDGTYGLGHKIYEFKRENPTLQELDKFVEETVSENDFVDIAVAGWFKLNIEENKIEETEE